MKKHTLIKNFVVFLQDTEIYKSNWHVKVELLTLISYLFLETKPIEDWFKFAFEIDPNNSVKYVDFEQILLYISKLLDNDAPKVRKVAMETLAVICSSKHRT